jgi:hypothetical protein
MVFAPFLLCGIQPASRILRAETIMTIAVIISFPVLTAVVIVLNIVVQ